MRQRAVLLVFALMAFSSVLVSQSSGQVDPRDFGFNASSIQKVDPLFQAMLGKSQELQERYSGVADIRRTEKGDISVRALIKTSRIDELERRTDAQIGSVHGDIVTVTFDFEDLAAIANLQSTKYIEASRIMQLTLDVSVPEIEADVVSQHIDEACYDVDGAGILVGIMDSGIDWDHPDFIDNDDTDPQASWLSRIEFIWDQGLAPADEPNYAVGPPFGYTYGLEYGNADVEAAIRGGAALATIDDNGHGSHVAGIAAGDGSSTGNYAGVAPESRIIVCKADVYPNALWTHGQSTAGSLDGFDWMLTRAADLGMPLVVNQSRGLHSGPHDGTTLYEQAIDNDAQNDGLIAVFSAGNARGDEGHATAMVPAGGQAVFTADLGSPWDIDSGNDNVAGEIQFWYDGADQFTVEIFNAVNPGQIRTVNYGAVSQLCSFDDGVGNPLADLIVTNDVYPENGDNVVTVFIDALWPAGIGVWTFRLVDDDGDANEIVNGYVERNIDVHFTQNVTERGTISIPSSAGGAITVASYNTKLNWNSNAGAVSYLPPFNPIGETSNFSSMGPLRNESTPSKPDISAPGKGIGSVLSSNTFPWPAAGWILAETPADQHRIMQGTSMASPHVAGAVALLLESFPNLTPEECKEILMMSAAAIPNGNSYGDPGNPLTDAEFEEWGAGKLTVLEAYRYLAGFVYGGGFAFEDKFKQALADYPDAGIPTDVVMANWNGFGSDFYVQEFSNGAITYKSGEDDAYWLGCCIWQTYGDGMSAGVYNYIHLGLPTSSQYEDPNDPDLVVADFEKGRIYCDPLTGEGWISLFRVVDIKPTSCPNPLNAKHVATLGVDPDDGSADMVWKPTPGSRPKGVIPVAILGSADFSVLGIDAGTIELEGVPALRWSIEDVSTPVLPTADECECTTMGPDGFQDLTLKFDRFLVVAAISPVEQGDVLPLRLTGMQANGIMIEGEDCVVIVGGGSGVAYADDDPVTEFATGLLGNYPNPFNPSTEIRFGLAEPTDVTIDIFNVMGQKVATPLKSFMNAGIHTVLWDGFASDGRPAASGVYFYRLQTGDIVDTRKMLLLK